MTRGKDTGAALPLAGGCLCGAVRFTATGFPSWIGICHCDSCRRATGGTLIAAAGFARSAVEIAGESLRYIASSPGVRRSFCFRCGTSLSYENERWPADIHLMVGAFDDPKPLAPAFHIFAREQLPWLHLTDALPRYPTTPSGKSPTD
jgi:hypothetical protein